MERLRVRQRATATPRVLLAPPLWGVGTGHRQLLMLSRWLGVIVVSTSLQKSALR